MNTFLDSFKKFIKSIKFNLFVVILCVSILPLALFKIFAIEIYKTNQIEARQEKIYNVAFMIKNIIKNTDYLSNNNSDVVNVEFEQLTSIYSGRIIVVDSNFTIIKDTYVIDEKKTCISESVINCAGGHEVNYYDSKNQNIEIALSIEGSGGETGVIYMNFTTSDITDNINELDLRLSEVLLIALVCMIGIALVYSALFVKPFKRIDNEISSIKMGNFDAKLGTDGYTEVAKIGDSFNHLLVKLNELDESRQEFVSNVSHELKTPITSIKVLADSILNQEGIPTEMYQEFLGDITEEIDRENRIITDLLNIVKLDKKSDDLNISSVNINEMIERVLKRLKPIAAKKNIELVYESYRPVMADVDEVKMTMVISNLVENAVKYNVIDGWVRVSLNADLKYFYVKISDSGIGIPKEAQGLVFERFYRVDKARSRETGGTGLGLAITSGAVHKHDGEIKLHSVEGEGTTFTIRIPLARPKKQGGTYE